MLSALGRLGFSNSRQRHVVWPGVGPIATLRAPTSRCEQASHAATPLGLFNYTRTLPVSVGSISSFNHHYFFSSIPPVSPHRAPSTRKESTSQAESYVLSCAHRLSYCLVLCASSAARSSNKHTTEYHPLLCLPAKAHTSRKAFHLINHGLQRLWPLRRLSSEMAPVESGATKQQKSRQLGRH